MPSRPSNNSAPLTTATLPRFDGPLDFFLHELRRQDVPIEELRLAPLVESFLSFVRRAGQTLTVRMEWIEIAAVIIRWRSETLLPPKPGSLPPDSERLRQDLIGQLLAYSRALAADLARRQDHEAKQPRHSSVQEFKGPAPILDDGEEFPSVWDLLEQARDLRTWVLSHRAIRERQFRDALAVTQNPITIGESKQWVLQRLPTLEPDKWHPVGTWFTELPSIEERASLFLGLLDLAREQQLCLDNFPNASGQDLDLFLFCLAGATECSKGV